jgi:hypothetical protein
MDYTEKCATETENYIHIPFLRTDKNFAFFLIRTEK